MRNNNKRLKITQAWEKENQLSALWSYLNRWFKYCYNKWCTLVGHFNSSGCTPAHSYIMRMGGNVIWVPDPGIFTQENIKNVQTTTKKSSSSGVRNNKEVRGEWPAWWPLWSRSTQSSSWFDVWCFLPCFSAHLSCRVLISVSLPVRSKTILF